jgi:endonuclease I
MKNKIHLLFAFVSAIVSAQDGAPAAPYYNGFNFSQTGTALKSGLANKITTTHTRELSYSQAENAIKVVDLDPGSTTNVLLVYGFSNNICPSSAADDNDHRRRNKEDDGAGASCQWNREHTYAKSLGNPDLGTSGPGADVHHLRASDVQRNGERGSDKFIAGSGNSGPVGAGWYPGDEWKGDIARMMMYMYLRYGNRCLPKNVAIGTVTASDPNMVALLLQWNVEDPVSEYEDSRNNYLGNANNTYGQGNRNPFIDNPYLATLIWGGPAAQNRWPMLSTTEVMTAQVSVYPNPALDNTINIYSEKIIDAITLVNINGQIVQQISKPQFSNSTYTLQNLPQGFYLLRLNSPQGTVTKKIIVN